MSRRPGLWRRKELPILTAVDHRPVPGGVVRALSDPVPLYPWSIVHRRDAETAGTAALVATATRLGGDGGWLAMPAENWRPQPEAVLIGR